MNLEQQPRRFGRFTGQAAQLIEWIQQRKRFAFFAPDYVVVSMPREEYDRLFAKKQRDFNYELFQDDELKAS